MKKYVLERYRNEVEDYVSASANFSDEEKQKELAAQDGTNWYSRKEEFEFCLVDTLDEVVAFLKGYDYVKDKHLGGLSEEDRV